MWRHQSSRREGLHPALWVNRRPENDPQKPQELLQTRPNIHSELLLRVSHYTAHPLWALGCQSRWGSAVEKEREGLVRDGWIRPTAAPLLSLTELVTFQPGNYHCRRRNSLINYQCQRCLCFTVRGHHAKRAFAQKQKPLKNERGSRSTDDAEEKHTHTHTHTHTHGQHWAKTRTIITCPQSTLTSHNTNLNTFWRLFLCLFIALVLTTRHRTAQSWRSDADLESRCHLYKKWTAESEFNNWDLIVRVRIKLN